MEPVWYVKNEYFLFCTVTDFPLDSLIFRLISLFPVRHCVCFLYKKSFSELKNVHLNKIYKLKYSFKIAVLDKNKKK